MPHFPRTPPTLGPSPEVSGRPSDKPEEKKPTGKLARHSLKIPKINMHTYEPDFDSILESVYGKHGKPQVDKDTGGLIL